jgi:hypothetical protein
MTKSSWHISGTVGNYSGFGLYFDNCTRVDASKYKGVSFKISGSVPLGNAILFGMGTLNNTITATWLRAHGEPKTAETAPGRCVPTSGSNQYDQPTCADNTKSVPVTATPTEVKILWEEITGGKPDTKVNPTDIVAFYWRIPAPVGVDTPTPTTYAVDLTIDDLSFIP